MEMKDSGKRQEFEGGAVRDAAEGKVSPRLFSPYAKFGMLKQRFAVNKKGGKYGEDEDAVKFADMAVFAGEMVMMYELHRNYQYLDIALANAAALYGQDRLQKWLEEGAKKYDEWNWAKGMFISRTLDSFWRHAEKVVDALDDEDHPAALMCNVMFALHYDRAIVGGILDPKWDDLNDFASNIPGDGGAEKGETEDEG